MKTDTQLKNDVICELTWDAAVDANAIGVEVTDGVVTLSGHVGNFSEKWEAERAAGRVAGLRALVVNIDVKLLGVGKRTDADIANAALSSLQWTSYLEPGAITVMVEDGWVTLSGHVKWEYQRSSAAQAVRHLLGVRGISNNVVIQSNVSAADVKSEIEATLQRRSIADAKGITVKVAGADVTLSGTVDSWGEREAARHSAWGTAGVQSVTNHIIVSM